MEMIKTAVKPEIIKCFKYVVQTLLLKSRTHLESKEISSDIGHGYRKVLVINKK